jgi:hypothetical protein
MQSEIGAVCLSQAVKPRRCVNAESLSRDLIELWASQRRAVICEADESLVEGCIP